jgi:hypothetical protein
VFTSARVGALPSAAMVSVASKLLEMAAARERVGEGDQQNDTRRGGWRLQ